MWHMLEKFDNLIFRTEIPQGKSKFLNPYSWHLFGKFYGAGHRSKFLRILLKNIKSFEPKKCTAFIEGSLDEISG